MRSKTHIEYRQAVSPKMGTKAEVSYCSRNKANTMASFPSPEKQDCKFYVSVIMDRLKQSVLINDLLVPGKVDALVQCKCVTVEYYKLRVHSLPSDYVSIPAKSYLNKYKWTEFLYYCHKFNWLMRKVASFVLFFFLLTLQDKCTGNPWSIEKDQLRP